MSEPRTAHSPANSDSAAIAWVLHARQILGIAKSPSSKDVRDASLPDPTQVPGDQPTAVRLQPKHLSLVKLAEARLAWGDTRIKAVVDLERLKKALAKAFAGETGQQVQLTAALERMGGLISQFDTVLEDRLDDVLSASDEERVALSSEARKVLSAMMAFVGQDALFQAIDENDLLPKLRVTQPVTSALSAIDAALIDGPN